ncbi:hypothetical protein DU508_16545 [Pedobacter chinensis]|uniref:Uncharacterized protein n=1 Tax=Pedobacter chinensis TaxID=2282421 RepID=A0A369Q0K6_9SPHI|nr:hypothetical protein [Pedobacter chinensis]RDC55868.1 hypothetical protein DU508_16545 [Pedobacter chinensis]
MYYSIKTRTDKEVGGVFPQVSCLNQQLAHSIQSNSFINADSDLLYKLEPKAKLTNVLSQAEISALGFLIDEKTKGIVKGFDIVPHNYNQATVKDNNGREYHYSWLHLGTKLEDLQWLDYQNSSFYVKEYGFRKEDISIKSYQDYEQKSIEVGDMAVILIEKIKIKPQYRINADMFTLPLLTRNIFISQSLKIALDENSITGISTEEAFE